MAERNTKRYAKLRPLIAGDNTLMRSAGTTGGAGSATLFDINNAIAAHTAIVQAHMVVGAGLVLAGNVVSLGIPDTLSSVSGNIVTDASHRHAITTSNDGATGQSQIAKFHSDGGMSFTRVTTPALTTASGNLTVTPVGRVDLTAGKEIRTTDSVTGLFGAGWRMTNVSGHGFLDIREIQVEELRAYLFMADFVRVQIGEDFITESMGVLYSDMTTPAVNSTTTLVVEDVPFFSGALFSNNDWVMLALIDRSGGGITIARAWGQVSGYVDLGADSNGVKRQQWTYTHRNGTVGLTFKKGSIVMGWGAAGQGYIHHSVVDSAGSPYTRYATWSGANPYTPANRTIHTQVGNLDSITDTVLNPTGYGLYGTNVFLKGALSAGNDVVRIDSSGMRIKMASGSFDPVHSMRLTENSTGSQIGSIYGVQTGSEYAMHLLMTGVSGKDPILTMQSTSSASDPTVVLRTIRSGGGGNTSITMASGASSVGTITFLADSYMRFGNSVAIGNDAPSSTMLLVTPSITSVSGIVINSPSSAAANAIRFLQNGTLYAAISPPAWDASTIFVEARDMGSSAGPAVQVRRNSNGSTPAAGRLILQNLGGSIYNIWPDTSGNLRIGTTAPSNAQDTSGTVVGAQTSNLAAKDVTGEVCTPAESLAYLRHTARTALRRFRYKSGAYNGEEFEGLITDYAPRYGMDQGRALNLPTVISDLIQAVALLAERTGYADN